MRVMRHKTMIGALLVVGSGVHGASAAQLGDEELKAAVGGRTVTIETPLGLPITVNYGASGTMTGTTGTALAVYLGAAKDRGRWQVKGGKLCQKWFKWLSGETTCLTLRQDGSKIVWRSDEGQTGTAMIEQGPPAFDGVTASGLGLPPPAAPVKQVAPGAVEEPGPKPAVPAFRTVTAAAKPAVPSREYGVRADQPAAMLALVELPREVSRPIRAVADGSRPQFALASLSPVGQIPPRRPLPEEPAASEPVPSGDTLSADQQSMRQAGDMAAIASMEHRWCLSNAFAKGPALPTYQEIAAPELVSAPSLLAVAQEQIYEGELPLHEASCLTQEPAIGLVAKLMRASP